MHKKIENLVAAINEETKAEKSKRVIYLVNPDASVFLRTVRQRAKELGIRTAPYTRGGYGGTILDVEKTKPTSMWLPFECDTDRVYHKGLSCAAEAVFRIIQLYDTPEANVGIVGRRHAVKGLQAELQAADYTALPMHSKTKDTWRVTKAADIIVNSARTPVSCDMAGKLVVDISGALAENGGPLRLLCGSRQMAPEVYVSHSEVAHLNIAILLNRIARGKF